MNDMNNELCELLSPAGSFEALKAAIENGADAVYLGGNLFNARQYAGNFDDVEISRAIDYAHLRGVNVYLTLNILIKDIEIVQALNYAQFVREQGIDGVIVQDLGLASELRRVLPDLPIHASTQMTVYDLKGAQALENMGFERVVLARELSIDEIKNISSNTNMEVETFVHGALCMCYSGQCLMSSMIGGRSGNRGTCAQPCRMKYELYSKSQGLIDDGYLLSTKDINLVNNVADIVRSGVKSIKIEGRMKSPEYVGLVTEKYRKALDNYYDSTKGSINQVDERELLQIFNRGHFSRGYYFGKEKKDIAFIDSPKNIGTPVGTVISYNKSKSLLRVKLSANIAQGDGIEVLNSDDKLPGGIVTGIEKNGIFLKEAMANEIVDLSRIKINNTERGAKGISKGQQVIKTSDAKLNQRVQDTYKNGATNRKRKISVAVYIKANQPMRFIVEDVATGLSVQVIGDIPASARTMGLTFERVKDQIQKVGDFPFDFDGILIDLDENLFVPISKINELRRNAYEEFAQKIVQRYKRKKGVYTDVHERGTNSAELISNNIGETLRVINTPKNMNRDISLYVFTIDKLKELHEAGITSKVDKLYVPIRNMFSKKDREYILKMKSELHETKVFPAMPNITRGLTDTYIDKFLFQNHELLDFDGYVFANIGQLQHLAEHGSIFQGKQVVADIGFNIFNSKTIDELRDAGLSRFTVSPELNFSEIPQVDGTEYIVYGKLPSMTTEYCPVRECSGQGSCTKDDYYLKDSKGAEYPFIFNSIDCRSTILSSNPIEIDDYGMRLLRDKGVCGYRINVIQESISDVERLIKFYKGFL